MAVDRFTRDALADSLAALLRDDVDAAAFAETLHSIQAGREQAPIQDPYLDDVLEDLDRVWYPTDKRERSDDEILKATYSDAISPEGWQQFCRRLVFLKTDFEQRAFPLQDDYFPTIPYLSLHYIGLAAATAGSFLVGWWLLWVVWGILGTIGMIYLQVQAQVEDRICNQKRLFDPFLNEEEWLAHQQTLAAFHLPNYEAWRERHPYSKSSRILNCITMAVPISIIVCMVTFMFAWSVMTWPLGLLILSFFEFCRRWDRKEAE